ncbi:aldo/keto reductase [Sporolactobacillus pectinivorans]|uniref:aldo/keto reductase n=1 Tax=Sporolactobacillus pectinivorans TaxID=1591408 RepID=UPI000C26A58B|nr:aldo/keto reductase [Sporolactobacillus pectinivorans]
METVKLNNHVEMPILGFGVYQISLSDTKRCVMDALETGYRLIDTAQYYGNEAGVGEAVTASGIPRNKIFITTKIQSNRNVTGLIDASLEKLRTDYIDLLLIHWVMGNDLATYRVMEESVKQGKVRAIGLSNFYGRDFDNIINHCEIMPAVNQLETHVFYQNRDLRALYKKNGTYLEAWAPFGEGKANMFKNPILAGIAREHNRTVAQVILRFLIQSDIIVIPKSTHKERMVENINVFDFSLCEEDMRKIEALDKNESLFGWY